MSPYRDFIISARKEILGLIDVTSPPGGSWRKPPIDLISFIRLRCYLNYNLVCVSVLLMLVFAIIPACTSESALFASDTAFCENACNTFKEYLEPSMMEKRMRMAANKKVMLQNLPEVRFSESMIGYTMVALERLGIGNITMIESTPAPAKPEFYAEGERFDVWFRDDLGSLFVMQFTVDGYTPGIFKTDKDGVRTMDLLVVPLSGDPMPANGQPLRKPDMIYCVAIDSL